MTITEVTVKHVINLAASLIFVAMTYALIAVMFPWG